MKWPLELSWVRHGQSSFNQLRGLKAKDPFYTKFVRAYGEDPESKRTIRLARKVAQKYRFPFGDCDTPITELGLSQAEALGQALPDQISLPDVVFVSPHLRAHRTLNGICESWAALGKVRKVEEPRLREQEHGLALLYNDWRVFSTLYPEQRRLREIEGPYWYRYPQGESVPDGIERVRSFIGTLVRDYSEQKVLVVSHHLTILFFLAAIFRWDDNEFIRWDMECKPINCGLTIFHGQPEIGDDGRLVLSQYNMKLY